jgi:hypothetical protein
MPSNATPTKLSVFAADVEIAGRRHFEGDFGERPRALPRLGFVRYDVWGLSSSF